MRTNTEDTASAYSEKRPVYRFLFFFFADYIYIKRACDLNDSASFTFVVPHDNIRAVILDLGARLYGDVPPEFIVVMGVNKFSAIDWYVEAVESCVSAVITVKSTPYYFSDCVMSQWDVVRRRHLFASGRYMADVFWL